MMSRRIPARIAGFEIAIGGVVCFHAAGRDPLEIAMCRDGGVRLIQIGIDIGLPGKLYVFVPSVK